MFAAKHFLTGYLGIITGAGSGIGRAVCGKFAEYGASIAAVDVNFDSAQDTVKSLPGKHRAFGIDISNAGAVKELFLAVQEYFSAIPNIVVNCAGITRDRQLLDMSEQEFDDVIKVNLKGTFLMTQEAAKCIIKGKLENASIVNISSVSAKMGNFGQANYVSSKSAVEGFTRTAAREFAKNHIRCNCVVPGFIDTPMTEIIPEKVKSKVIPQIPMQRFGKPEEIANACLFLASDFSSYITGTTIEVTGGLYM